jgi:hypothetical protein
MTSLSYQRTDSAKFIDGMLLNFQKSGWRSEASEVENFW